MTTITPSDELFSLHDWLGIRRAVVGASLCGTAYTQFPYGDGLSANPLQVNGATLTQCVDPAEAHYTGKDHDNESGNDYFGARYYQSTLGRWMIPDFSDLPTGVPFADFADPQTLNLYNYVRMNPLGGIDSDGHWPSWQQVKSSVSSAMSNPRIQLAEKALGNVAIAGVKLTEAAGGAALAPETGGLSLAVTFYQGVGAAGNLAAAGSQLVGAISGDVKSGEQGAKVANAATTISGITSLVSSGGDVDKADAVASQENLVTTGLGSKSLLEGSLGAQLTKVGDAAQTAYEGGQNSKTLATGTGAVSDCVDGNCSK